ncbi:unnamed protein product [Vitrella brassicaformis CCMP3155]|uniref:RING-type domain-containing protein n=2 Tax=Vitrella brassicaformis TaxID=1169539 RepID=A0A0G4GRV5_VITBC|nr:unnamed protein product [Vitrella brassicaformis CCMP3155]|eukprot:CEM33087.1 unnamed protein product [Vitrella brassicaformis CCMP3155]
MTACMCSPRRAFQRHPHPTHRSTQGAFYGNWPAGPYAAAEGGDYGEWPDYGHSDGEEPPSPPPPPFPIFEADEAHAPDSTGSGWNALPMGWLGGQQGTDRANAAHGPFTGPPSVATELQREREERRREKEQDEREKDELRRQLAALSFYQQQQQPPSSSSSSAPPPPPPPQPYPYQQQQQLPSAQQEGDGHECAICFDAAPSVMYMPCRHLRVCRQCYDHRRSKLQQDLQRVRAENVRRGKENEDIERQNQGRKKEDRIALVDLLDEPEYLCEHCKERVVFAGSREEVRQWAARAIT